MLLLEVENIQMFAVLDRVSQITHEIFKSLLVDQVQLSELLHFAQIFDEAAQRLVRYLSVLDLQYLKTIQISAINFEAALNLVRYAR